MTNPYQTPAPVGPDRSKLSAVQNPAMALLVVSAIAVIWGSVCLIIDAVLLATGAVARLEAMNESPLSEYTQLTVRSIWGVILVIASSFVFYGALKMRKLENYGIARTAAMIAMTPCVGPCCLLGIPFGVWAYMTLNKPEIRQAFH